MAKVNHELEDFLVQMAEDPAKFEEYERDPNKVLSTFEFPEDIKSDIVSGKLENIRRHMSPKHHGHGHGKHHEHEPGGGMGYGLSLD
jgi:hypothetical protein